MRAGLDPRGDGSQARRRPRHWSHHEMEAGRERPVPLGGHLARVTRGQGTMAPVGMVVPGRRGATPTVPRVGGTGMEVPVSRPGGSTRQSSAAVPWRDDRSSSGHGTHPDASRARFLLARNAS